MKRFVCVLSILALFCASANAAVITQTWSQAKSNTNWTRNFTVQQFDPALGTLNSVTMSVGADVTQILRFENTGTGSGTIVFQDLTGDKTRCEYIVSFTGGAQLLADAIFNTPSYTYQTFDGVIDFGGTSGATNSIDQTKLSSVGIASLAPWIGTGNVALTAAANGFTRYHDGGNMTMWVTTNAGADVTVTYDYIPEPATLAILGLGGLLLRRRIA